jgi:tRNA pseudouridine55 synthase
MIKQGKQIAVKEDEEITEKFIRLYKDKEFAGIGRYVFSEHKIAPHKVVL